MTPCCTKKTSNKGNHSLRYYVTKFKGQSSFSLYFCEFTLLLSSPPCCKQSAAACYVDQMPRVAIFIVVVILPSISEYSGGWQQVGLRSSKVNLQKYKLNERCPFKFVT